MNVPVFVIIIILIIILDIAVYINADKKIFSAVLIANIPIVISILTLWLKQDDSGIEYIDSSIITGIETSEQIETKGKDIEENTITNPPIANSSISYENTTTSYDTEFSSVKISDEGELETTTSILETETTSLSLDNNCENEPNNDFPEATPIEVNQNIEGILDSKNDEDYYIFNLTQKGKVSISFNHEKFDSSYIYWNFNIYDSNSKRVHTFDVYGNVAETESDSIRLSSGKYYCKINSNNYEYCKYTFNINFQGEYENYETEDNNDFPQATPINVNQSYIGNIQDKYDKDYFKFEISQKGNISISFNHEQFNKYYDCWEIHLISDEKTILVFNSTGSTSSLTSDVVRLPVGTYYLKITSNNFNNLDYTFSVNYNDENEYFESEPNNDYKFATIINLDTEYIGNIQSKNDVDFYEINITDDNTSIEFYFMHEITDKNYTYWNVYFLDTNGNGLKFSDDNSKNFSYLSISGRESKTKFYINDLSCGKYYIKIRAENYKNDDYSFFVSKI